MPGESQPENVRHVIDEPPPFLGTWGHIYVAVLCYLAVLIALFYLFARVVSA
jgi:hypothetical protein